MTNSVEDGEYNIPATQGNYFGEMIPYGNLAYLSMLLILPVGHIGNSSGQQKYEQNGRKS